jgi:hypothetical protein
MMSFVVWVILFSAMRRLGLEAGKFY